MGVIVGIGVCIALFAIGRYILRDAKENMNEIAKEGHTGLFFGCAAIGILPILLEIPSRTDTSVFFFIFLAAIVYSFVLALKMKCFATAISTLWLYIFLYDYLDSSFFAFALAITFGGLMFFVDLCLWDVFERKEKKSRPKIRPRIKSKSPTIRPNKVK